MYMYISFFIGTSGHITCYKLISNWLIHHKGSMNHCISRMLHNQDITQNLQVSLAPNSAQLIGQQQCHPSFSSVQFSSVAQSCPTLCDPLNRSMPGLPVHHQLPEFTQTQVHRVGDAIQPSDPLSSPSPPAPNPSQHQSLFQ